MLLFDILALGVSKDLMRAGLVAGLGHFWPEGL